MGPGTFRPTRGLDPWQASSPTSSALPAAVRRVALRRRAGRAKPVDANRNAILGYLAGALQGGNLGQSIGRGLQGWLTGAQTDATEQARRAAAQYVAQQPDIDLALDPR